MIGWILGWIPPTVTIEIAGSNVGPCAVCLCGWMRVGGWVDGSGCLLVG